MVIVTPVVATGIAWLAGLGRLCVHYDSGRINGFLSAPRLATYCVFFINSIGKCGQDFELPRFALSGIRRKNDMMMLPEIILFVLALPAIALREQS